MPVTADITKIEAPASAQSGEQVIVDISIKNIGTFDKYLAVTSQFDSSNIPFQFDYLLVSPGETVVFRGWFTMPSKSIKVTAWGWYWTGTEWVLGDTVTKNISLLVIKPEFSGFGITEYVKR